MVALTLGFLLALVVTAFFTAAELALFSLSETRVRVVVEEGFRGGGSLARLRSRPDRLLIFLRLGRTLAAATGAALAAAYAFESWGATGLLGAVIVAGLALVVAGELIPMGLAAEQSLRLSLAVAPTLAVLVRVLDPLLALLERFSRLSGRPPSETMGSMTEGQIRELTALGRTEGLIEEHERQLVERAFKLDETKAWEIMTPRVDVFAWPDSITLDEIATELQTVPYSRVPVYGDSIDDITGVLYVRDAYQAVVSGRGKARLRDVAREPLIVPGALPLTTLLRDFQGRRIHMAVVVDEYGGTDGLVTLEDVIEELVGEIVDETDVAEEPIVRLSRNEILAEGDADLREINHIFNTSFPQLEHRSLNGYLLEAMGRVPRAGERITADGVEVEVLEATETQVVRARLVRTAAAVDDAADASDVGAEAVEEPAEEEGADATEAAGGTSDRTADEAAQPPNRKPDRGGGATAGPENDRREQEGTRASPSRQATSGGRPREREGPGGAH